jgi:hypothetical protein
VDRTGPRWCPVVCISMRGIETSGFAVGELVISLNVMYVRT